MAQNGYRVLPLRSGIGTTFPFLSNAIREEATKENKGELADERPSIFAPATRLQDTTNLGEPSHESSLNSALGLRSKNAVNKLKVIIIIDIITQVIIEILALSLAENGVIFRYNHLRGGDSVAGEQGRLLSDWLICYPSTQTLFERALPKILKTKMASERAISC